MSILDRIINRDGLGGMPGAIVRAVLRLLQFVLAVTVAGLYGVDLNNANKAGAYTDGKWVFAEVVAGLAAGTVLIYIIPGLKGEYTFPWDWILFILWTALFGLFGKIYIPADPTPEQHGQQRMKSAVWVDLVNMILWFFTAIWGTLEFLRRKNSRTLHTGRSKV